MRLLSEEWEVIKKIVTPQGEWDCVIADSWDGDRLSEMVEPVLVWGLTAEGQLIPITSFYPAGVTDPYALRRAGSGTVYSEDGSYPSAAEWLDMQTKRARRLAEQQQG